MIILTSLLLLSTIIEVLVHADNNDAAAGDVAALLDNGTKTMANRLLQKIISCYAKCARTCWHTKVYDGWLVVL